MTVGEKKVERLLQALIEDLINGVEQREAGYRATDDLGLLPSEQKYLFKAKIIEKNSKGMVRFKFANIETRKQFKSFDLLFKQLDYFLKNKEVLDADLQRLENASKLLENLVKKLKDSQEHWPKVIAIGWWKMLESSALPSEVDEILKEGFSPKDWAIKTVQSSPQLGIEIANRVGKIDSSDEALSLFSELGLRNMGEVFIPFDGDNGTIQKIKKVLKWNECVVILTQETIKMLGLFWFSLVVLEFANLLPMIEENSPRFIGIIWTNVGALFEKDQLKLIDDLKQNLEISPLQQMSWTTDVFRIPEAI
ncbi:MAG: hypothetical protein HY707_12695 [Ignavibacteriae bacterium]|nr:hypothetical protein [Ignavibacteriota bacterium]